MHVRTGGIAWPPPFCGRLHPGHVNNRRAARRCAGSCCAPPRPSCPPAGTPRASLAPGSRLLDLLSTSPLKSSLSLNMDCVDGGVAVGVASVSQRSGQVVHPGEKVSAVIETEPSTPAPARRFPRSSDPRRNRYAPQGTRAAGGAVGARAGPEVLVKRVPV